MEFGLLCRTTLHISLVGPNAKTVISPLHAHVCPASLFITCLIYSYYVKARLRGISVEVSFKSTGFSMCFEQYQATCCLLPPCGRRFWLSSRLKYCDTLEK